MATSRQNISGADQLYWGSAFHHGSVPGGVRQKGVPVSLSTKISLGAPTAAAANNISLSQSVTVATTPLALLNGTTAGTLDVPRNVVAAWTGTAVLTVTGTDYLGATMVEASASGTSFTGKKAFKTVTSASFSANVTAATIGTGAVLGLPYALASKTDLLATFVDETADAGTTVVAVTTDPATATTGDVRGTYAPASAPDGTKVFQLRANFNPSTRTTLYGVAQFAG